MRERGFQVLVLVGIAFFHRPLFFGESFFQRDLHLYFLPLKKVLGQYLAAGEWPLWNVYLHGGQPFVGEIMATVLYPSTLLALVLPAPMALSLDLVGHFLLSTVALYLLARRLGLGQPAAALGGVVYGYCGFTLSQANLYFRLLATPYLPLMLLCWQGVLSGPPERRRRWLAGLVILGALQVFAGSAEMVVFTWLTLLGWGLALMPSAVALRRRIGTWLAAGLLAAALAAPQLVPLLEMVGQSPRGEGLAAETFAHFSLHPLRLPELVIPGFMGRTDTLAPGDYWGAPLVDGGFPLMLSLYCGSVVLILALLAGSRRGEDGLPRSLRRFLGLFGLLALVLALGRWLPGFELLAKLPGATLFRYPIKCLTLAILPLALLAGDGAEQLCRATGSLRRRLLGCVWGVTGVGALLGALWLVSPAFAAAVQRVFFAEAGGSIEQGLTQAGAQGLVVWLLVALAYQAHRGLARSQ
ncbi:MAG: hypothetical protein AAF657_35085, partial [Acidobacteriota bacterium]